MYEITIRMSIQRCEIGMLGSILIGSPHGELGPFPLGELKGDVIRKVNSSTEDIGIPTYVVFLLYRPQHYNVPSFEGPSICIKYLQKTMVEFGHTFPFSGGNAEVYSFTLVPLGPSITMSEQYDPHHD